MGCNWRQALFAQARADYGLYLLLTNTDGVPVCYLLQMLQKSLEKLLKALSNDGLTPPETKHEAFDVFFRSAGGQFQTIGRSLGLRDSREWESYLKGLAPLIRLMENLAPRAKQQANSEYPWEEREFAADGGIRVALRVPAQEGWSEWAKDAHRVVQLQRFLEACFEAESA